jgi:uncharacterized protein (TIGR03663 family)
VAALGQQRVEEDKPLTVKSETTPPKVTLDTPILTLFTLNWELILYGAIFLLAIFTRFYILGARVMSHDESLHTLYSWNLYAGKGYQHDPLMHGPFLFHITALMYFLFGDNDFTARLSVAGFGVALVMLPYWFRPWLGRLGALATSVMILMSPGLMYYSRYIRNEAYINVDTVLMVLAFFQFMRTRRPKWLYIGAMAVILMHATKEVSYIHGFIGFSFITLAYLGEILPAARRRVINYGLLGVAGIILALAAYGKFMAEAPSAEGGFNLFNHIDALVTLAVAMLTVVVIQPGVDSTRRPANLFVQNVILSGKQVGWAILAALIVWTLLHTTFFSNIGGLYSGAVGAIVYWLEQHSVQRGGQPWYYYLMLLPMYEFLPVLVGGIGGLVYLIRRRFPAHADAELETDATVTPSDGGMFGAFLIYWAVLSLIIYSWAGEKMPWLSVHMTLPLTFLAGHIIQTALGRFRWREAIQHGGPIIVGAILLLPAPIIAIFSADPFRSQSLQAINDTSKFIAGVLLGVIGYFVRKLGTSMAAQTALVAALILLSALTIRFAVMLNFINYDYPSEVLVYAHASPDVKLALNQIDDISRRTVGDKMIRVAYDNDSTWPLEWYMREYPNRVYYGENPTREALDAPIVIVGSANESKAKPYLGDKYTGYNYRLVWWPIEDYKNESLSRLWETYVSGPAPDPALPDSPEQQATRRQTVRDNWRKLWKIWFYRDYEDYHLNEWPFVHRFTMYVRNDVLNEVWDYSSGPVQLAGGGGPGVVDPYEGKRADASAIATWGSNGPGDGQFASPHNVAVAPDSTIYVADSGNHRVEVFDKDGKYLTQWGQEGAGPGQFSEPWGLTVGLDGRVYVADTWNHRVQIFSPSGEFLNSFGEFANVQSNAQEQPGNFWGPRDIAVDVQGNLYVTDTGNKRVQKFTADGQFLQSWGGGGIIPGTFEEPVGLDIDKDGNIYVADTWNHRIQKFDANFTPLLQWDVTGWDSESVVNKPYLAVDHQNRVFVSDPEGYRIIGYNGDTGAVLVTWGQYGQDPASFKLPIGVEIDPNGMLLVADADNNRIMKFEIPAVQ